MGTVAALGACLLAFGWRSPTGAARIDQLHALLLAAGWTWVWLGGRHRLSVGWRLVVAWALPVALIWRESYQFGWVWLGIWVGTSSALGLLSHEPHAVRRAVLICGLAQLPLMALQACGVEVYAISGGGLAGSLGKRYVLSALLGLCSLWSTGWQAWVWLALAGLTGSVIGVGPAVARLLWQARRDWRIWAGVGNATALLLCGWLLIERTAPLRYLTSRLLSRWEMWQGVWQQPWPPVGFGALRGPAFVEEAMVARLLNWQEYHSVVLESWARFGPWALVLLGGLGVWAWRRSGGWVSAWMAGAAVCQSVEAYPVLAWLLAMGLIGGRDGVGAVQKTVGVS